MAETKKRIIQYNEELTPALDDYLIIDSPTAGTRKILASNIGGGGGNANVTELTYAQYMALTPAERANGTIYMVTNDPNDSGVNVPINYSTAEQDTGLKWIDGKKIYQKTYHFVESSETEGQDYSITDINADFMVSCEGTIKYGTPGGNEWCTSPRVGGGGYYATLSATNAKISVISLSYKYTETYVTLRYTKTTD